MSFLSTSAFQNILTVTYSRPKFIAPHERFMAKFYDAVKDFPDGGKPLGRQRSFFIMTGDAHSGGYVAEGGDYSDYTPSTGLEAFVVAKEIAYTLKMTTLMQLSGQAEGMMAQLDIIDQQVQMTTRNLMSGLNRATLCNSNQRIGVVEATVATSNTFYAALPQMGVMFRKNMLLDFYTAATPGETDKKVGYYNHQTRLVTLASGVTVNATAGDGIYQANCFGAGIFGLRAIVDDGTDSETTIFGITRSTNPEVNATLMAGAGGYQSYSELLLRTGAIQARLQVGVAPTDMWCNDGVMAAHFASLTGNRFFTVGVSEGVPGYKTGADVSRAGFEFDGKLIKFNIDNDLPAEELYLIHTPYFRRHVLKPANWWGDDVGPEGTPTPQFLQAPASSGQGYASAKVAGQNWFGNMANVMPRSCVRFTNLADPVFSGL